jgi:AAA ATPase domain
MNNTRRADFTNPFRPGAGHMPPYLAGREKEAREFRQLLEQDVILKNLILTGLRGVGKTVLLQTLRPIAIREKWLWVGTDLSESASISEETLATRLLTDLSVTTSSLVIAKKTKPLTGFTNETTDITTTLNYATLLHLYQRTPGLVADKLKHILEFCWQQISKSDKSRGIIFAYDEAQNLSDYAAKDQFPLSLLLDVFQSIQRKEIPFMLILTGLPTLFPKLVEARTYSERMFHVLFLDRLNEKDSRDAILKPIQDSKCTVSFDEPSVKTICNDSGGYPYFIQFICREVYDVWIQQHAAGQRPAVPAQEIVRKLDSDFFAGRWARATDRQRELLRVISKLENCDFEFTVQEIVSLSKKLLRKRPFSSSHVSQMLGSLSDIGLIYKNRHGKYSFAVPLLGQFILRQELP